MEKRIAIIGVGISGLLSCKYVLEKGFTPIVFEADDGVCGVWTRTIETTKVQTPTQVYRFSDFPWPSNSVHDQDDSTTGVALVSPLVLEENGAFQFKTHLTNQLRFSGLPKLPDFPINQGPEVFNGVVVHSMDYSAMEDASAAELINRNSSSAVFGMDYSNGTGTCTKQTFSAISLQRSYSFIFSS
ncbi:hypothetical protein Syun_029446 [Stephania yunnanensis]|uniref:Flavin-containing monooxygenase n=1 Tax=Stephania yunnanensis TaxID=152371 RepID=A0AAP0E8Z5_9MAGN